MQIHLATHHGMCFGVRSALRAAHAAALQGPVTLLGPLVHNPVVDTQLRRLGVQQGQLEDLSSATTERVIISAHGASDAQRQRWREAGKQVTDTTCPLVRKAHQALALLVEEGYHPVVIGQRTHIEVRGLIGDFPQAQVVLGSEDLAEVPEVTRLGVIAQTTQPLEKVLELVQRLKEQRPSREVRFVDTVCHPTRQRQASLEELCARCEVVLIIGGRHSNNTQQLVGKATALGVRAHHLETAQDLHPEWLDGVRHVGVTAGTSTPDETVQAVLDVLHTLNVNR